MRQRFRSHLKFRLRSRSRSGGPRLVWLGLPIAVALLVAVAPAQAAPFAYVANENSNSVSQYGIGAGGLLASLSPPTVGAGESPRSVAVSPDGRSVYATNLGSEFDDIAPSVSQYDVGAGGSSRPRARPRCPPVVRRSKWR